MTSSHQELKANPSFSLVTSYGQKTSYSVISNDPKWCWTTGSLVIWPPMISKTCHLISNDPKKWMAPKCVTTASNYLWTMSEHKRWMFKIPKPKHQTTWSWMKSKDRTCIMTHKDKTLRTVKQRQNDMT